MTERQADQKWVEDTRAENLRRAVSHSTNTVRLVAHVRLRWWLRLYLHGVAFMAALMDAELDMDKVGRQIKRGLVVTIKAEPLASGVKA